MTPPFNLDDAIDRVRLLRSNEFGADACLSQLRELTNQAPSDPRVLALVLEVATDIRPWLRGSAMRLFPLIPDAINQMLPLLIAALRGDPGNYGGGWDESTQADAIFTLEELGVAAVAAEADVRAAFVRALDEHEGEAVRPMASALIAITDPNYAAACLFEIFIKRGGAPADATDCVLIQWPPDLAFPAFLSQHPDRAVRQVVEAQIEMELKVREELRKRGQSFPARREFRDRDSK